MLAVCASVRTKAVSGQWSTLAWFGATGKAIASAVMTPGTTPASSRRASQSCIRACCTTRQRTGWLRWIGPHATCMASMSPVTYSSMAYGAARRIWFALRPGTVQLKATASAAGTKTTTLAGSLAQLASRASTSASSSAGTTPLAENVWSSPRTSHSMRPASPFRSSVNARNRRGIKTSMKLTLDLRRARAARARTQQSRRTLGGAD